MTENATIKVSAAEYDKLILCQRIVTKTMKATVEFIKLTAFFGAGAYTALHYAAPDILTVENLAISTASGIGVSLICGMMVFCFYCFVPGKAKEKEEEKKEPGEPSVQEPEKTVSVKPGKASAPAVVADAAV